MLSLSALILAAAIWGFAFVAQRMGLESLDPFTFNALRFGLGALCVALLRAVLAGKEQRATPTVGTRREPVVLGVLLFAASSLQQTGMLWTGAGSAGFITGLYVVFVPWIGISRGTRLSGSTAVAVALAVLGLWLLNSGASLNASLGNGLVLAGAVFWAFHIHYIDILSKHRSSLDLAVAQYAVCAALSAIAGLIWRIASGAAWQSFWPEVARAGIPLLYTGVMSVGVAFTLQLDAQKRVPPQTASVVLCLEGVFALLGGWLLLSEKVTATSFGGAFLLFGAMLVSVFGAYRQDFLIDKKGSSKT